METGIKNDGAGTNNPKLRMDLIPVSAINGLAKVLTYGSVKYGDYNWSKLENPESRYYSALMRHLMAWKNGEKIDSETGFNHLEHILANAAFLLEFELKQTK